MQKTIIAIVALLIVAVGIGLLVQHASPAKSPTANLIASVLYSCDAEKTIKADLYEGTTTPPASPGEPPIPGGSAKVVLSDGRTMTLAQTISADGVRYANADESFIFWTKGNGAFVMEGDNQTYANCAEATSTGN